MDRDIKSKIGRDKRAFFIYEKHFDVCFLCLIYLFLVWILLFIVWILIAHVFSNNYDMPDVKFQNLILMYIPFYLLVQIGYPYIRTKIDLQKKEGDGGYDA